MRQATKLTPYLSLFKANHGTSITGSPDDPAAFQASETKKWKEIADKAGMKEH